MSFFCQTYGGGEITWIAAELYAPFTGRFGKSSTQVGVGWEGICDPGGYTHSIFLWEGTQHLLTRYLFSFWMSRVYTYIHIVSFRLDFVRFFSWSKGVGAGYSGWLQDTLQGPMSCSVRWGCKPLPVLPSVSHQTSKGFFDGLGFATRRNRCEWKSSDPKTYFSQKWWVFHGDLPE